MLLQATLVVGLGAVLSSSGPSRGRGMPASQQIYRQHQAELPDHHSWLHDDTKRNLVARSDMDHHVESLDADEISDDDMPAYMPHDEISDGNQRTKIEERNDKLVQRVLTQRAGRQEPVPIVRPLSYTPKVKIGRWYDGRTNLHKCRGNIIADTEHNIRMQFEDISLADGSQLGDMYIFFSTQLPKDQDVGGAPPPNIFDQLEAASSELLVTQTGPTKFTMGMLATNSIPFFSGAQMEGVAKYFDTQKVTGQKAYLFLYIWEKAKNFKMCKARLNIEAVKRYVLTQTGDEHKNPFVVNQRGSYVPSAALHEVPYMSRIQTPFIGLVMLGLSLLIIVEMFILLGFVIRCPRGFTAA